MSHDTRQRPDDLGDLPERLHRLGRTLTAGSTPWPGVDAAIRRDRAQRASVVTVLTVVLALLATAVAWSVFSRPPAPPAEDSLAPVDAVSTRHSGRVPPQPWGAPTGPYTAVYTDVPLHLPGGTALCGRSYAIDLMRPAVVEGVTPADLAYSGTCEDGVLTPTLVTSAPSGDVDGEQPTPGQCATAVRLATGDRGNGQILGPVILCLVVGTFAAEDPAARVVIVKVAALHPDGSLDLRASAWTGGRTSTRNDE
jgi:hypothetical protein